MYWRLGLWYIFSGMGGGDDTFQPITLFTNGEHDGIGM